MKTITRISAVLFLALTFISCQITEKIDFNKDGSGVYSMKMDMSAMMKAMKNMNTDAQKDSTSSKVIDTIINFNDFLKEKKDSIDKLPPEEKAKLESIKDFKMHVFINEDKDKAITEFIYDFKNTSDLHDMQDRINKANTLSSGNNQKETAQPTRVVYHFDGKNFHREVVKNQLTPEQEAAYKQSVEQGKDIIESSSYIIEYHFPRPIKSTSFKDATFSDDRKTIYIYTNMKSITENPELLDFKIELQ